MHKNVKAITVLLVLGCTLALSSILGGEFRKYQENPNKELDSFNEVNPFPEVSTPSMIQSLVFGTFRGDIVHLDPVYAYDSASIDVIDQVVERLYWFNISDPNYPAVPQLATAMPTISPNGLEYTIPIRQNVMFHDNTTLDAAAVKWNFDRLMWFCNYSGNQYLPAPFNTPLPPSLPSGIPTPTQLSGVMYLNPDGTPIINETVVVNANTIKFILNQPRGAWLSILTFSGSGIMSPASTPANDYIQLFEDLVGTGPFMYDSFTAGVEIKLSAFYLENLGESIEYWQGRPQLDTVTIVIYPSLSTLNQALLSGDIDILTAMDPAFIDQHDADLDIHLEYAGGTLTTGWVTFNVDLIPLAMRKSVAYSLNYTYIIDVVYDKEAVRLPTYIPMGIAYANYTLDYPTFNRTKAREILLNDPTYGPILTTAGISAASPDSAWTTLADGATPLEHYNYSWNTGNTIRQDTGDRLAFDLRYIGVKLDVNSVSWGDLITMIVVNRHELGLYMLGWRQDYMDPENYISAIWGNESAINGGNYNALDVQALMAAGLTETDPVAREAIYQEIQRLMVERDYPGLPLTTGINYDAWKNEVKGYISNPLGNVWFYPVYTNLTASPSMIQSLVFGSFRGDIVHLDPVYAYDSASIDVIDQVVERLYWFNISDPNYPAVPALATAMPTITPDGLEYTIPIRQNVMFHDNTTLDAAAVKWNFDRLMWFCNYSDNQYLPAPFNTPLPLSLQSGIPTPTQLWWAMYQNPDGTPIINETVVVNTNTIKFILNQPRGAWLSILTFSGSGIMSPASTPANDYIQLHEDLVGTGPFMYDSFTAGVEIKLSAFYLENLGESIEYWQGRPQLDTVTIVIYPSLSTLNQALLSGDIDILTAMDPAFIDQHDADLDIHLEYAGGTLTTSWVTFNMDLIPLAMRKSVAYSLNYSYIIDVVYDKEAVRLPTYIPMGIAYANYTLDYPTFNRTKAREILLNDPTYGPILTTAGISAASPDSAWTTLADGATPLEHYNYTWNTGNTIRQDTGNRLAFDLRYIGVTMDVIGVAWGDLVNMIVTDREYLGLYMIGWRQDYMDPENYISAIWGNESAINGGNYNALDVQALMAAGFTETDPVAREAIYQEIQRLMVERDYPGLPLTTGINYDAWKNGVKGYISNPLGNVWLYPVYFESTPPDITIHSPVPDQVFGVDAPTFNITIVDDSPIDSTWYTIDGGLTNFTFSGLTGTINQTAWDDAGIGSISLTFYANDTLGYLGSETVNISKDTVAPDITIHSPVPDQVFGIDAPTFNITIVDDSPIDSTWYTIDGGLTNFTFSGLTGTINQTAWDDAGIGSISLTFYANDSLGNLGSETVNISKDTIAPDITIHSPVPDQVYGVDAPTFNITIVDDSPIDSTWYTIDGGLTNFTFSGLTGTINQTAWDDAGIGSLSLIFYANDSLGNLGSETVNIFKDTVAPDITIHSPVPDHVFGIDAPTFNITIVDDSPIDSTWYTIDGGLTNYTFSGLIGGVSQTAWDEEENGLITIIFFARDEGRNVGSETVIIIKKLVLFIEFINLSFTSDEFNIIFFISNERGDGIDFATIEMWWNYTEVSSIVQNLGNGLYFTSLDPITVAPDEDPILLTMNVSASGYNNKYFELALAVDPVTLDKVIGDAGTALPQTTIIIIIASVVGGGVGVSIMLVWYFIKKRAIKP